MPGRFAALLMAGMVLCACHHAAAPGGQTTVAEAKPEEEANPGAGNGVSLTPAQIEKLGIVTQAATATAYSEEAAGFGVVVNHETIAQAAAELTTAQATERLSRSALARAKKLSGTPGAVSADVEETAAQKAEVDAAALTLTTRRLSSMLGMNPPWHNGDRDATLQALAAGKIKLLRVTFPLGTLSGATPGRLRAARIGTNKPGAGWEMNVVWDAPADAAVPGRSFFALLKGSDAGEGERLQVWAPIGKSVSGVSIPASAAVLSEGKFWCFVQRKPGTFARLEIDTTRPTSEGYFVADGVVAGDQVVTAAVGQLLAKESGSGSEPD